MTEKAISVRDQQIDTADLPLIAEQLVNEYERRKKRRSDREKIWTEVDRQLAMTPDRGHKMTDKGKIDPRRAWLPEVELPLQSQTLEMLVSDCRRLIFPRGKEWFLARAAITEKYLQKFDSVETPFVGEKGAFQGVINQDNADRLAQAAIGHYHRQYNLRGYVDIINAEALSYGFGVGRFRKVKKRIMGYEARGRENIIEVPMLIPRSTKHTYLDDSAHAIMHEGHELGPNIIQSCNKKLADLKAAAQTDDSYVKDQLDRLEVDKTGEVLMVELEGDLVYETSQETIVVRDVEITVAKGSGTRSTFGMIRYRPAEGSSFLIFDYHLENASSGKPTSPLVKGQSINAIMALMMNDMIASGSLDIQPPLGYSSDDPTFAHSGGPIIEPGAQWPSTEEIRTYAELGGDPNTFFNIFSGLKELYDDVTGVNAPRLGAQTKSHTTAFAKDAELSQGAVRTVDYVDSSLDNPLTRFLEMEYRYAKKHWTKQVVYVDAWNEFVELQRSHLPDIALFKALGDATTIEDLQTQQKKTNAIQTAMQIDAAAVQLYGTKPKLDPGKLVEMVLHDGGVQDISEVTTEQEPEPPQGNGQLPGILSEGVQ